LPNAADLRTERLAGFLVQSFFKYRVPQLQALQPDEILEVRAALSDTKQGFTDFIFELTDDLEQRLKDGTATKIEAAAKIVERKLAPKYDEYLRQLRSKKAGFWSRVLAASGKFFQIDASPLTPKFYAHIDRLKNALPVRSGLPRFHEPTFFFQIVDRLVDSSSNALSSFVDFHSLDHSFLGAAFFLALLI
jgi:hypothetical protein